jgi:hypothetical protein
MMDYQEIEHLNDEVYDFLFDRELDFELEPQPQYAPEQPLDYVVEEIYAEDIYY